MTEQFLKSLLTNTLSPQGGPQVLRFGLVPKQMQTAAEKIALQMDEIVPAAMTVLDLDRLVGSVRSTWRRERSIESLTRTTLKQLPWALFHPISEASRWLAADSEFLIAYLRWLERHRSTGPLRALIHQFLSVFPADISLRRELQHTIVQQLAASSAVRVRSWAERHQKFALFDDEGPHQIARGWLNSNEERSTFEREVGLQNVLAAGAFAQETAGRLVQMVRGHLASRSLSAESLERSLTWLRDGRNLRFPALREETVAALLLPFEEQRGTPELERQIQTFLLDILGDPRTSRSAWNVINPRLTTIIRRWLVGATLEDFFRVLDQTAVEHQWLYRKLFWTSYLKRDVITDAWVVLGPDARLHAGELTKRGLAAAGLLIGGYDPYQSVLVMKIDTLVIGEWSHNGSCRFWPSTDTGAPQLYDSQYQAERLRRGSDASFPHISSQTGSWQRNAASYIRGHTGISVFENEYMPRNWNRGRR